jgi:hypothetical protein
MEIPRTVMRNPTKKSRGFQVIFRQRNNERLPELKMVFDALLEVRFKHCLKHRRR